MTKGIFHTVLSGLIFIIWALGIISIILSAIASFDYFKNIFKRKLVIEQNPDRKWLKYYSFYAFAAMIISVCLSPVVVQSWHITIILIPASITVVCWLEKNFRANKFYRWAIILFIALRIPLALSIVFGHPWYR